MSNFYDPPSRIPTVGNPLVTIDDNVTATGSTSQANSYAVTKAWTVVTTTAANTGVRLPVAPGQVFAVHNTGASTLFVYPPVGAAINGGSTNAKVDLVTGVGGLFLCVSATRIVKLGDLDVS
jgi:hypothetical protein